MFEKRNQHCPSEESLNCKTYVNLLAGAIPWHFMQIKAVRACRCIQWDEYHWMAHRGPKVSLHSRVRASSGPLYPACSPRINIFPYRMSDSDNMTLSRSAWRCSAGCDTSDQNSCNYGFNDKENCCGLDFNNSNTTWFTFDVASTATQLM